jgi:predicted trehalose synthase
MSETSLEKFKKFWADEVEKIEKVPLNARGGHMLYMSFENQRRILEGFIFPLARKGSDWEEGWEEMLELDMIEATLIRAIYTAETNFELQNKSIWVRIFSGGLDLSKEIIRKLPPK